MIADVDTMILDLMKQHSLLKMQKHLDSKTFTFNNFLTFVMKILDIGYNVLW